MLEMAAQNLSPLVSSNTIIFRDGIQPGSGDIILGGDDIGIIGGNGELKSRNYVATSVGWRIQGSGDVEFNDIVARGAIYATSGDIAGWVIDASTLSKNDAVLASAGYLVLGTGNNIVRVDAQDATYRIWVGNATAGSAPFRVEKDGSLTASSATITGSVTATTGAIGGWSIGATTLTATNIVLDSGNDKITVANITLDGGADTITLGTSGLVLDGTNKVIRTDDYVADQTGWNIDTTLAEFNNIVARGELRSYTIARNVRHASGGLFMIAEASDVLIADVTVGASSIDVKNQYYEKNHIVIFQPSSSRFEAMQITNAGASITDGYRYSVTRNHDASGANVFYAGEVGVTLGSTTIETRGAMLLENDPDISIPEKATSGLTWQWLTVDSVLLGTGVSAYGGAVRLDGTDANGPMLAITQRNGPGYSDFVDYVRIGRMTNFADHGASREFGIGAGDGRNFFSWVRSRGLRVVNADGAVIIDSDGIHLLDDDGIGQRPELLLESGTKQIMGRVAGYAVSANKAAAYITTNIYYDGSNWNLDDTDANGTIFQGSSGTTKTFQFRRANSGTNPVTPIVIFETDFANNDDFLPGGAGTQNLGNASQYWNDVSYKTLTDRGCLGWYDDGVEMQNGEIVSDVEALKRIRKHPTLKTPAGAPRLDYRTMPLHVYKKASIATEDTYRYDDDKPTLQFRKGEKMGEDGAETTALISIVLGAIKELSGQIDKLQRRQRGRA